MMRPHSAQRLLAKLESVGASVSGSVGQSVAVVSGESGLAAVQKRRASVALVLGLCIVACALLVLVPAATSVRLDGSTPCAVEAPRVAALVSAPLRSTSVCRSRAPVVRSLVF